jgi:hypothetical protein
LPRRQVIEGDVAPREIGHRSASGGLTFVVITEAQRGDQSFSD